jgi:pilus assembly protein CpaF
MWAVLQAAQTTGSTIELLDADVRDAVRRHGVDPQANVSAVRRLAETAVAAHDQRSLTGLVEPVEDPASTIDELVARIAGFGPLQRYLDDPSIARSCQVVPCHHDPIRGAVLPVIPEAGRQVRGR